MKWISIIPLHHTRKQRQGAKEDSEEDSGDDRESVGEVIGALIVEQIESNVPRDIILPRTDLVCQYGSRALSNALDHSNLFLMPLWKVLGKASGVLKARTLPKTVSIAS